LRRTLFLLAATSLSTSVWAQSALSGTKADLVGGSTLTQSTSSGGFGPLFNVLLALGIVYGILRFAMPKVMSRISKRLVTGTGSAIRIEESATFAGGSLYVVSARGKTLLLGVGTQGVQTLADLTEERPQPEPATFGEMVQEELTRHTTSEAPEPRPSEWAVALERLERLAN